MCWVDELAGGPTRLLRGQMAAMKAERCVMVRKQNPSGSFNLVTRMFPLMSPVSFVKARDEGLVGCFRGAGVGVGERRLDC